MTDPSEWVAIPVRGWVVEWVRALNGVQCLESMLHEETPGALSEEVAALMRADMIRRLRAQVVDHAEQHDLLVLGFSEVRFWSSGRAPRVTINAVVRFLAIERAPLPAVEDWGRWAR